MAKPPKGDRWVHEIKVDGYRLQLHIRRGTVSAFTRRGNDWAALVQTIVRAAQQFDVQEAILDGELIAPTATQLSDFETLQSALGSGNTKALHFFAFDLLYLDGYDLRLVPLMARKAALARVLAGANPPMLLSDVFEENGATMHARGCASGLEGIVSKLRDSAYRSGRTDKWIKVTCRKRDTFPVVAFVPALAGSIAALYLGHRENGALLYAGKAGTGFTGETARRLRERLDPMVQHKSPLTVPVKKPKATWVKPELLVDIEYRAMTADGHLRHASFKGIRDDLTEAAPAPVDTRTAKAKRSKGPASNIQRALPGAVVPTKDQLRAYWKAVGKRALPYLANRPLTLVRHVDGVTFFHTRTLPPAGKGVRLLHFEKREGGEGVRAYVDSVQGFLGLVDMDVIELHPWNARVDDIEHPDQMVFDLDPGDAVEWELVTETALALRDVLRAEGYEPWPKATGGKGLHVMVPLKPERTHDAIRTLSKSLASRFAVTDPRYTVTAGVSNRRGKIFIDYLRNGRGQTAVGPFSPRARPNFPVAAPLEWSDVERELPSDAYTINRRP